MKFCQETLKCSSKGKNYQQRGSHVDFHNICGPRKSRKPENSRQRTMGVLCFVARSGALPSPLSCAFKHETIAAGEMQAQGVVHVSCARATYPCSNVNFAHSDKARYGPLADLKRKGKRKLK